MTTTIDAIYNAVSRLKAETFHGIGTPVIELPIGEVSVSLCNGSPKLFMTMDNVIKLATSILDMEPPRQA